jgi:hypothetical protein
MGPINGHENIPVVCLIVIVIDHPDTLGIWRTPGIKRSPARTGQHLVDGMPGLIFDMRPVIQMIASAEVHPDPRIPEAVPEQLPFLGIIGQ